MTRNLVFRSLIDIQYTNIESLRSLKNFHLEHQMSVLQQGSLHGARIQLCQFWSKLRSSGKIVITFFTDLGLKWFKRYLKASSVFYLPTKIHNFWLGWSLPVYWKNFPYFLSFPSPHCPSLLLSFHTNPHLKSCNKALVFLSSCKTIIINFTS